MLSILLKKLVNALEPLNLLSLALIWLAWSLHKAGQRKPLRLLMGILGFLFVTACLPVCDRMLAALENPWRDISSRWDSLPEADAIFCLGGGIRPSSQEIAGVDLIESSDRATTAIELLRRGKAQVLLISGGEIRSDGGNESVAVKGWVERWQLAAASKVETLPPCKDTHDEALKLAEIAKQRSWKRILLVTSASHMKRAAAVVGKPGAVEVIPVPCAFQTSSKVTRWLHLPEPASMEAFSTWWHEIVGWWVYKARGWI